MSTPHPCPRCGNIIPEDTPKKVCPICCLLDLGLSPSSSDEEENVPGVEIGALVGKGSFGEVFEGIELHSGYRRVAIKILHDDHSGSAQRARFLEEMQILARLDHPNLVTLYRSGRTTLGNPFYIMELVEGSPLDQWAAKAPLPQQLDILVQITRALAYAHQQGIAHRDLKPANILIAHDSHQAKVIDFGIARAFDSPAAWGRDATVSGQRIGTPRYMSPEQLAGDPNVDLRTDIWSLGLLIYEFSLGKPVLSGLINSQYSWDENSAHLRSFAFPKLPDRELDWIARKACSLAPADRYQTGQELLHDLEAKQSGKAVSVGLSYPSYRFRKSLSHHRLAYTIATALILLTLTLAAAGWWLSHQEKAARQSISQSLVREKEQHQKTLAAEAETRRASSDSALFAGTRSVDTSNYREARQSFQEALQLWPENSAARFALNFLNATLPETTLQAETTLPFIPVKASPHPQTGFLLQDPEGKIYHFKEDLTLQDSPLPLTPVPTTDPDLKLRFTEPSPGILEVRDLDSNIPLLTPFIFGSGPEKAIYSPRDRSILVIGRGTTAQLWNLDCLRKGHQSSSLQEEIGWVGFERDSSDLWVTVEPSAIWKWPDKKEPQHVIDRFPYDPTYLHWNTGESHHRGLPPAPSVLLAQLQILKWRLTRTNIPIIFTASARTNDNYMVAQTDGSLWFLLPYKTYKLVAPAIENFTTAAINSNGTIAARISGETQLELIDLIKREVTKTWTVPHPVQDLTILDNGHLVLTHLNGAITVWDSAHPDSPLRTIEVVPHPVTGFQILAIPGKEEFLVCLDGDITVRRFSAATGKPIGPSLRHKSGIYWMLVTGDPDIIFTIDQKESGPGALRIWSLRLASEIIPPLHHPDRIHWVTTLDQGTRIATSCADKVVRRWILAEGEKEKSQEKE